MFCSDNIRLPEVFIITLSIPPSIFCSKMIDIIKGLIFKDPFKLTVIFYICPDVIVPLSIVEINS